MVVGVCGELVANPGSNYNFNWDGTSSHKKNFPQLFLPKLLVCPKTFFEIANFPKLFFWANYTPNFFKIFFWGNRKNYFGKLYSRQEVTLYDTTTICETVC